ncbi:MAG: ExbD/TolR family protein [Myxococcota bacterium]
MNFRPDKRGPEEGRIDIAPLIDVVFLLLLFFLLTTTFADERLLDLVLPDSGGELVATEEESLVVEIGPDGTMVFGDELLEEDELFQRLEAARRREPERVLLIAADKDVPHGLVVSVMDLARRSGLQRVSITTKGEPGAGSE